MKEYFLYLSKVIGNFPQVLKFNRLFLKVDHFI
jgi:hypothetical protein